MSSRTTRPPITKAVMLAAPVATALIIAGHPHDPATAQDLGHLTDRYVWIHVALLFALPLLGFTVWKLLESTSGQAADFARISLVFAMVFYAAFDSLVGIAGGLLSREALALGEASAPGAEALVARWLEIPMPLPIISTIGTASWTVALLAAAVAHHRAGSPRLAVIGLALAGPLFGFGHPLVFGLIGMAGLLVAVVYLEWVSPSRPTAPA